MAEYFSHDYSTSEDEKIKELLYEYGWEGYGIYWRLVEMLYQNKGYLKVNYKRIARDLSIEDEAKIKSIINDFELFIVNETHFHSESVIRRLEKRAKISQKRRDAINKRWGNQDTNESFSDTNEDLF